MELTVTSYSACPYHKWKYGPVVNIFPVYRVYIHHLWIRFQMVALKFLIDNLAGRHTMALGSIKTPKDTSTKNIFGG